MGELLQLLGTEGQVIWMAPAAVISMRRPRDGEHFHRDAHCIITTVDGKFIAVMDQCADIARRMRDGGR
jgi:hypothetical protein